MIIYDYAAPYSYFTPLSSSSLLFFLVIVFMIMLLCLPTSPLLFPFLFPLLPFSSSSLFLSSCFPSPLLSSYSLSFFLTLVSVSPSLIRTLLVHFPPSFPYCCCVIGVFPAAVCFTFFCPLRKSFFVLSLHRYRPLRFTYFLHFTPFPFILFPSL